MGRSGRRARIPRPGASPAAVRRSGHDLLRRLLLRAAHFGRILAAGDVAAGVRPAHACLLFCALAVCHGVDTACRLPLARTQLRSHGGAHPPPRTVGAQNVRTQETLVMFAIFVGITLVVTYWASGQSTTSRGFYAAHRRIGGLQNGWAIAGEYFSA